MWRPAADVGQTIVRTEKVRALRLDTLQPARLDLLKVDVEGTELDVLEGAVQTIERCRPYVMAELRKVGSEGLFVALQKRGYRCEMSSSNPSPIQSW